METIDLVVRKRNLRFKSGSPKTVIAWNTGYIINFDFDEDWEDLKTIKIVNDKGDTISDTLFSGNSVEIPKIYNTGYIGIGIYAGDLKSTTPLIISCQKSILDYDGSPIPPSDDVYNKIMDLLNGIYNGETGGGGGTSKTPYIGDNGNWYEWDANMLSYVDTGVSAGGSVGEKGDSGYSPVIIENASNTDEVYKLDITTETESYTTPNLIGKQGIQGEKGEQGIQGVQGIQGERGLQGEKGDNGYTPVKGKDYYTTDEKNEIVAEVTTAVKNDINLQLSEIEEKADNAYDISVSAHEYADQNALRITDKVDKTKITNSQDNVLSFEFSVMNNAEIRASKTTTISFTFGNGEYAQDYISGMSFDSGETATAIDYTDSGILNWVGTDCTTSDGLSIFQPSANTHYDVVFYFNGVQFIGLVNGFVPATGNEAV